LLQVPDDCKQEAEQMLERWKREDISNWEQLSNQACAAGLGWVERVPGTCQAGGPPPICVEDHWVRSPFKAQDKWKENKADVRREREQEMVAQACSCYRAKLNNNEAVSITSNTFRYGNQTYGSPLVVPCSGETCPPGFSCRSGVCRPLSAAETRVEQTEEVLKGIALEEARDKALEFLSKRLSQLLNSMKGRVALGVLEAEPTSLWKDGYKRTATRIYESSKELLTLSRELDDYRNGRPARGPNLITRDIQRVRASLTDDVRSLSEYYNGVVRERELCRFCCYEVFEYQHQKMIKAYSSLMGVSAYGVGEMPDR
jgi:hypothetical protein